LQPLDGTTTLWVPVTIWGCCREALALTILFDAMIEARFHRFEAGAGLPLLILLPR